MQMKPSTKNLELIEEAKRVFDVEARSILDLKEQIQQRFLDACEILKQCRGKIVVTGIGKSGLIGRKIAATLSSTGTPSFYLHPAETSHGDMGVISENDVVLALSYGGESAELKDLLGYVKRHGVKLISMTGNPESTLGLASDIILNIRVKEEACPLKLAPTSSTAATLAMGDALAVVLMKMRGFKAEDFAEFHPGGSLGRKLLTHVQDIMHGPAEMVLVPEGTLMKDVIFQMAEKPVRGAAGVVDSKGDLIGIITDGDLRRRLEQSKNPLEDKARDLMKSNPKVVDKNELAEKALHVFQQFAIQTLFVVDQTGPHPRKPVGLLHLQDILRAGIR